MDIIETMPEAIQGRIRQHGGHTRLTWTEQARADALNASAGSLQGYDCPECKNRGYIAVVENGIIKMRECACMKKRRSLRHIRESGLSDLLEDYTFDKYQTPEAWQADAKQKAQAYVAEPDGKWFVACGTVGSGKSHLCTAICGAFLEAGKEVRYMRWRDDSTQIKASVTDDYEYARLINPLKKADVLYIDDLFKGGQPSEADKKLAFEIIDYRYGKRSLPTIISGERTVNELLAIDEAVGSRICERCKGFCVTVTGPKNWRLK